MQNGPLGFKVKVKQNKEETRPAVAQEEPQKEEGEEESGS